MRSSKEPKSRNRPEKDDYALKKVPNKEFPRDEEERFSETYKDVPPEGAAGIMRPLPKMKGAE